MKTIISAESTIDCPQNLLDEFNIKTVPFTLVYGDQEGLDGEVKAGDLFDYSNKTKELPKTSAVNQYQYEELFASLLKTADAIVHISLSSDISSAYNNAVLASKKFKNVYVVDSRTLSTGIALLAFFASDMAKKNVNAETIYNETIKQTQNVQASFVLDTLKYLRMGGRCSALALLGSSILQIKPKIVVKDGKMQVSKKYMGTIDKVTKQYVTETLANSPNPKKTYAFVTHSGSDPEVVEFARQKLLEKGFLSVFETVAGATISCHCGPKTLGILYLENK